MFAPGERDPQLYPRSSFPMAALFKIYLLCPCPVLLPSLLPVQIFHYKQLYKEEGGPKQNSRGHGSLTP